MCLRVAHGHVYIHTYTHTHTHARTRIHTRKHIILRLTHVTDITLHLKISTHFSFFSPPPRFSFNNISHSPNKHEIFNKRISIGNDYKQVLRLQLGGKILDF